MFQILAKTIADAAWLFYLVLGFLAFINVMYFVLTHTDKKPVQKALRPRMTWDLTRDTRFINLD